MYTYTHTHTQNTSMHTQQVGVSPVPPIFSILPKSKSWPHPCPICGHIHDNVLTSRVPNHKQKKGRGGVNVHHFTPVWRNNDLSTAQVTAFRTSPGLEFIKKSRWSSPPYKILDNILSHKKFRAARQWHRPLTHLKPL